MMPTSYHESFLKKTSYLFNGVVISGIVYIVDEDDEIIDNVIFLEIGADGVVGFYINGPNPFVTRNNINEFDDFNLHASYEILHEKKSNISHPFKIEHVKVFFHPSYNEVISIFLSSPDFSSSVFIVFSNDEIYVYENCKEDGLIKILKNNFLQFGGLKFFVYQKNIYESGWNIIDAG
ncbi:hypothetical protein [Pectobacterium wasabiae]|nr:hypothetical protein [Pectobacterium wasabiae]EJS93639.1 Hypothetical protein Y17_3097 [Pectobacterium wasabiae CFBP 3304]